MSESTSPSESCTVCAGTREEHANAMHAFTINEGELITPKQKAEAETQKHQQQPSVMVLKSPASDIINSEMIVPGDFARLIRVLREKGIIDSDEAFYVLFDWERPR